MHQLRNTRWLILFSLIFALVLTGCPQRQELKVSNYQQPSVGTPSPDKSFWRDTVVYPFPVKYAKAKDAQGTEWEIAYMDEYAGKPEDKAKAPALVLVHGKGANAGYWAELMKAALQTGLRVVAFDIPHYGKSIPGNLDKPFARTLQDTREAGYDLLVKQLGIKKATYLGHSLGAGWVLGFYLSYPDAVEKLVIENGGHFEAYPRMLKLPSGEVAWLDPSYARDLKKWEETWEPWSKRLANTRAQTEEGLRLFHYFKRKNPDGQIVEQKQGFFLNENPIAQWYTDVEVGTLKGPKAERESYVYSTQRDVYAQGMEMIKDDPKSIPNRLGEIKVPMLIIFGEKEPFLPATVVTGNTDLRLDYIKPTYEAIVRNGGPAPVVKFYADAAHFPHVDVPEKFNKDVLSFVWDGQVEGAEDPSKYKKGAIALPADIKAFVDEDVAAVKSGNVDRIMAQYHKDFKSDGRDFEATKAIFLQYAANLAGKWDIEITDLKIEGNMAEIDGKLANVYTTASLKGTKLIKEDGRWKWYGNRK